MTFLARALGKNEDAARFDSEIKRLSAAALNILYDRKLGLFVSGAERQISFASQVWMVLAGILSGEENAALLDRVKEANPKCKMMTPYMMHHYIEALCECGKEEEAFTVIRSYWGGMVRKGADTFFEIYNENDDFWSHNGAPGQNGYIINSYCHAWSCTPTIFIRRKYLK